MPHPFFMYAQQATFKVNPLKKAPSERNACEGRARECGRADPEAGRGRVEPGGAKRSMAGRDQYRQGPFSLQEVGAMP